MESPRYSLLLRRPVRASGEKGFTLLELIVVTALIGTMLAISVPSWRNALFTDPLKATTRKIIGLVTGVRELAVRSQQPYLVHISQLENRIWYEKDVGKGESQVNGTSQAGKLLFPESVRITGVWVGAAVDLSEGHIMIWISKQGYLVDTIIRLEDDDGNHLNVQFYPFLEPAIVSDEVVPF
jgi:prepilin-type N-terminal cleavage/methylation domain-containing protein